VSPVIGKVPRTPSRCHSQQAARAPRGCSWDRRCLHRQLLAACHSP
jgi:hypothetical protein